MIGIRRSSAGLAAFALLAGIYAPANAHLAIGQFGATRQLGTAVPQIFGRVQVADIPRSMLPARDFGRRLALAPVTASIILRYNRQSELDALVEAQSNRRSPLYHHFLTNAQFNNYFAPTPQQQAYVIANLQAAGLRVTHTFPNRTLLDVVGTNAAAERFFNTEIHSFSQGRFGARFANVRTATIPANLAPLIRSVSISNLIFAKAGPRPVRATRLAATQAMLPSSGALSPGRFIVPVPPRSESSVGNAIEDPGFESGAFGYGWGRCETQHASPLASITNARAHSGEFSGVAGSPTTGGPEPSGFAGVCQLVKIPSNGVLTAYLYQLTNQQFSVLSGEDVFLIDTSGNVVAILASGANNHTGWVRTSFSVGRYSGRELYVYFGVHGDASRSHHTQQFVDDVTLTSSGVRSVT